jgi:hypothetical protein
MDRRAESDPVFARVRDSMLEFQRELQPWKEKGYLARNWLSENVYEAE